MYSDMKTLSKHRKIRIRVSPSAANDAGRSGADEAAARKKQRKFTTGITYRATTQTMTDAVDKDENVLLSDVSSGTIAR